MVEDDIYQSKKRYEAFIKNINRLTTKPRKNDKSKKYYCKNKVNISHYSRLIKYFDTKDLSYVKRLRLLNTFKIVTFVIEKDLKDLEREDINEIIIFVNSKYSQKSKCDFIKDLKYIWRNLFPEKDEKGRIDETITPYAVRHLVAKTDISREKRRKDKFTFEEFEKIVNFFNADPRIQCYLTLAFETLGRPQEILYTRLRDIQMFDNYAKISISEHGKEGIGYLYALDSFPYLVKWLQQHPKTDGEDSFLFINLCGKVGQLTPFNITKKLRLACKHLGISRPITSYSLKRNGVTYRRLMGDSDVEIQKIARWKSNKVLKNYDLSDSDDILKIQLVKKGLIKDDKLKNFEPKGQPKKCLFCETNNGFNESFCNNCKRPLNRSAITKQFNEYEELKKDIEQLKLVKKYDNQIQTEAIDYIKDKPEFIKQLQELMKTFDKN